MTITPILRRAVAASWLLSGTALAIPEGPAPNTPAWVQREALNYAKTTEAPTEQLAPAFQARWLPQSIANLVDWNQRALGDSSWLLLPSGNTPVLPLCTTWALQCAGDPFRYPGFDPFYENEAEVIPVVIYDQGCARLSGRVWAPKGSGAGANLPAVVIENGSIQAPEPLYWWMAQALVRQGYVVMSFDPRGQGRSDQQTPSGEQGSNLNSAVFWEGLVNVIDFFRSTPVMPYPHNASCAGTYPTPVTDFNPFHDRVDRARLGIAGHSLGATGVSVVQAYGGEGAEPWPGRLDRENPVKVVVAWDSLRAPGAASGGTPAVVARVPAMGQTSEYGIGGTPFTQAPDPESDKAAYSAWRDAGVPVYQLTIQGSTHFEWSLIPTFPATSWCPEVVDGHCAGGWGRPLAEHYSLAWFDRWLKQAGEPGYDDADARLLADSDWVDRYSFYARSARAFPKRDGGAVLCEDIRAGCGCGGDAGGSSSSSGASGSTSGGSSSGSGSGSGSSSGGGTSGSSSSGGSASGSGSGSGSSSGSSSSSSSGGGSGGCEPEGSSSSSSSGGSSSGGTSSGSSGSSGSSTGSGSSSSGAPGGSSGAASGGALPTSLLLGFLLLGSRRRLR